MNEFWNIQADIEAAQIAELKERYLRPACEQFVSMREIAAMKRAKEYIALQEAAERVRITLGEPIEFKN